MVRTHPTPFFLYPKKLYINLVKFCPVELPALVRTMTSDYVSWVLGLQGWERAINEDSYMAGEEDVSIGMELPFHTEKVANTVYLSETGCQTPASWADCRPAQKEKESRPESPPTRLVLLRPGMQRPNPP